MRKRGGARHEARRPADSAMASRCRCRRPARVGGSPPPSACWSTVPGRVLAPCRGRDLTADAGRWSPSAADAMSAASNRSSPLHSSGGAAAVRSVGAREPACLTVFPTIVQPSPCAATSRLMAACSDPSVYTYGLSACHDVLLLPRPGTGYATRTTPPVSTLLGFQMRPQRVPRSRFSSSVSPRIELFRSTH